MRIIIFFLISFFSLHASAELKADKFKSKALGVAKSYRIYLPDGYNSEKKRYPAIYLLHGWGVKEDYWANNLGLLDAAKSLDLKAIIVMPDGDRSYYSNSIASVNYKACLSEESPKKNKNEPRSEFCVKTPKYEDYIIKDLIPYIDKKYRTIAKREARAMSGESAGGFGAMQLALRHKDIFSSVAVHSAFLSLLYDGPRPYVSGRVASRTAIDPATANPEVLNTFGNNISNWKAHDPISLVNTLKNGELDIYFDCGAQDEYGFHDEALYFDQSLTEKGIDHEFKSIPGGHNDEFWKKQISHSLNFHLKHFRKFGVYKD